MNKITIKRDSKETIEVRKFVWGYYTRKRKPRWILVVLVIVILLSIIIPHYLSNDWNPDYLDLIVVCLLCYILTISLINYKAKKRYFNFDIENFAYTEINLSKENIEVKMPYVTYIYLWSYYQKFEIYQSSILLFVDGQVALTIRKSEITDDEYSQLESHIRAL